MHAQAEIAAPYEIGSEVARMSDDGSALMITMTDGDSFGPFPIGGSIRPMSDHQPGLSYIRGDIVAGAGSSYLCMIPHEAVDLEDDVAAGKWMVLAQAGGGGEGGGSTGPAPFHMSMLLSGNPGVGIYTRIVIPVDCTLVAAGVRGRTRAAPGAAKTCDIAMAKYNATNAMTPVGGVQFTGTSTVGSVALAGGGTAFAAGDVLEMGLYAASAGHAATDYGVTFTFVPTA